MIALGSCWGSGPRRSRGPTTKWVKENPEDAEGKKELAKAEQVGKGGGAVLGKGGAAGGHPWCEGGGRECEGGGSGRGGGKAQEEEAKGSRDVVFVAEGVQRCRASEWLAGVMGG